MSAGLISAGSGGPWIRLFFPAYHVKLIHPKVDSVAVVNLVSDRFKKFFLPWLHFHSMEAQPHVLNIYSFYYAGTA